MSDISREAVDSWLSWLDDLPVHASFDEGVGCLQDYILSLRAALDAAEENRNDW